MEERDLRILKHVGLYRISLRPVLERALFDGRSCGNVMHRLIDSGYIQFRKGLPGNYNYYQLSAAGAGVLGLPRSRADVFGPQALHAHLGILWFCFMDKMRRYRLEDERMEQLLGPKAPPGDHCLEEGTPPRIFHVYAPGPATKLRNVVRQVVARIGRIRAHEKTRDWLRARSYAFLVLVETEERSRALKKILNDARDDRGRLSEQAYIRVATVPGFQLLKESLRARSD